MSYIYIYIQFRSIITEQGNGERPLNKCAKEGLLMKLERLSVLCGQFEGDLRGSMRFVLS